MTDLQIWQWTLTKESFAPCFVRDVLTMRQSSGKDADFFWLGHTPCRTVLLFGMVVAIQVYDKRTIYTIDDSTAVIDCILRHPSPTFPAPAPRSSPKPTRDPSAKIKPQRSPQTRPRLDKAKPELTGPPPPITERGYSVRVVGKVVQHYQSKQIHADTIDPCPSSLDEIAHLERVIDLHKMKYSLAVPFVLPSKSTLSAAPRDASTPYADVDVDASIFSNPSLTLHLCPSTASYSLPAPPPIPMPLQNRNQSQSAPMDLHSAHHKHTHVPPSPIASSIVSSTPSSPCKLSSPIRAHEVPRKPKLRHPSRLHSRDLTANTFRLYVKHYMDNAPPPSVTSCSASWSACGGVTTPTKHARDEGESDELTPRPHPCTRNNSRVKNADEDGPTLGFTLSHLRRVPELALLAARVVRAETRKRNKTVREKEWTDPRITSSTLTSSGRPKGYGDKNGPTPMPRTGNERTTDPPRKKMVRLFSWAVVKLYEEGSIVLWDGDVLPLPVPPSPSGGLWNNGTTSSILEAHSALCYAPSTPADLSTSSCTSASVLYNSSASASLYSHYHAPRRPSVSGQQHPHNAGAERDIDVVDPDADPAYLSDPPVDEEAYVSLTPRLLAGYVREVVSTLRNANRRGDVGVNGRPGERRGAVRNPTPEDILVNMQRTDGRWARVGVWAVEEALIVLKEQ